MIVTIASYDPVKGKGVYRTLNGDVYPFTYKNFCGECALPIGSRARLIHNSTLCPYQTPWQLFKLWIKEMYYGYRSK